MKKLFLTLLAGAALIAGCGDDKKETDQRRAYIITRENAVSVTRLGMQVAAIVGRHAVVPAGSTGAGPTCPISGQENLITITPDCTPDFDTPMAVSCDITETYECPEVTGEILNETDLSAEGADIVLAMSDYKEGNDELGFINYNGGITIATDAEGTTTYNEVLSVNALTATGTRELTSTSGVTVTTEDTNAVMNGIMRLQIVGLGAGLLDLQDVAFDPACPTSPVSGVIDMALVGLERAQLVFDSCGSVTLFHYDGSNKVDPEQFTEAELQTAFASAISDVVLFTAVAGNVQPAAESVAENAFCVPLLGDAAFAEAITTPVGTFSMAQTGNPISECIGFSETATTGTTNFIHFVQEDLTGIGAFGDPTQIKILKIYAGALVENVATPLGNKDVLTYAAKATDNAVLTTFTLDEAGTPTAVNFAGSILTTGGVSGAFCDPQDTAGQAEYCMNRFAFDSSFDHLGWRLNDVYKLHTEAGLSVPAALGDIWFVHILR